MVAGEEPQLEAAAEVDERGDSLGFEPLVVQLFEFMLTLAGSSRYRALLAAPLTQILYLSLGAHLYPCHVTAP